MKKSSAKDEKKLNVGIWCAIILAYIGIACAGVCIYNMKAQIAENRVVYVYNLEEVLRDAGAGAMRTKFEEDIIKLNDELFEAENKIKNLKDEKVKVDFSDVYLKNLKMKRDETVAQYENNIKTLTDKINNALAEIAAEKKVATVFMHTAIAVNSSDVVDISPLVTAKIKK